MSRRYRRRKSAASSILSDTAYIGSRLPWWGALLFGLATFLAFYYFVPEYLQNKLSERSESNVFPALEIMFGRRIHWFQWVGIACGLLGCFFAVRNYFFTRQAGRKERGIASLVARLVSRNVE